MENLIETKTKMYTQFISFQVIISRLPLLNVKKDKEQA